jgi:AcrR family transcriptional regulator
LTQDRLRRPAKASPELKGRAPSSKPLRHIEDVARGLKQERSAETRERLIVAAMGVIAERGYAEASTPLVAEAAGVSRGALQYHFSSRDDLFLAVRRRVADLMDFNVSPADLIGLSTEARVNCVVDHYWSVLGSSNYIAALEIRLYERFNERLHRQLTAELRTLTESRDQNWVRIFADAAASTDKVVIFRRFMLDALRGFALRQMEEERRGSFEIELDLLKAALVAALSPSLKKIKSD